MIFYSVQAIFLGLVLLLLARQKGSWSTYSKLYVLVWTSAVIAVKFKYGAEQSSFYSYDQQTQLEMFGRLITNGFVLSPQQFVADRYLIIVPVRFLNIFGIEPILATKFLQAISVILLYRICVDFLKRNALDVKLSHAIFFAGPLFIFLSILGLRDLEIALATTYVFLGPNIYLKQISLALLFPLRPHLAVAIVFGWVTSKYFNLFKFKKTYLLLILLTVFAFMVGGYGYVFGRNLQFGNAVIAPEVFQQDTWWRYFSNLVGLQFLAFDEETVSISVVKLLGLRLIFVDTFLIPICFIVTLMSQKLQFSSLRLQVFLSFTFFLGLAAQTDFNSTRQNLPFLSTMGVLALLGLLRRNDEASEKTNQPIILQK